MNKVLLLLIFTAVISSFGVSQSIPSNFQEFFDSDNCGLSKTIPTINNKAANCSKSSLLYNDLNWYRPDNSTPTKYIRLNFVFMQKDDGTGGFQEDNPDDQQYWTDVIQLLNDKYANLVQPNNFCTRDSLSGECYSNGFISNSNVQFLVNKIYVQDTDGWDNKGIWGNYVCPNNSNWYLNYLDNQINSDASIEPALNVFFTEEAVSYDRFVINNTTCQEDSFYNIISASCSMLPNYNDINAPLKVNMRNHYTKYSFHKNCLPTLLGLPYSTIRGWGVYNTAGGLAHEIGHCFFPTINHCNGCSPDQNSQIMNQCGTCSRNYLATQNIENIHRTLAVTNMRRFVDNCTINSELEISGNQNIDFNMKLYRDLKILSNSTLSIDCHLVMLENPNIKIEQTAFMNINADAILETDCNTCLGTHFDVSGTLNINNTSFNFSESSTLNITSTGIVNINSLEGLCLNQGTQISIAPGGKFIINGQDYTSLMVNGYNNVYDKYFNSQNITGNHYALNKIETSGNVQTQGVTNLKAGRRIVFKPGFVGKPGLHASIDVNINNCEETPCAGQGSHLKQGRPSSSTNSNTSSIVSNNRIANRPEQENTNVYQLKVFPNPNSGIFTLNISATDKNLKPVKDNEQFSITIINTMGKKIFEKQVNTLNNNIDISNLSKGIYHVSVIAIESGSKMAEAIIIR